ncbi:MAG: hypothetical protein DELT_02070 [Desulfovibrio sp.]
MKYSFIPTAADNTETPLRMGGLLFVAFCGGMLPISNLAMISSAFLALSGDFNTDTVNLTTMILGNLVMMCLTLPLANYIQQAVGLRFALLGTLALLGTAGIATSLAATAPGLGLGYAFMGLGGCLYLALSSRIIMVAAPQKLKRVLVMAWAFSIGLSSNFSPILGGILVEHFSWHSLFLLSPLVAAPAMIIVLFLVPDIRPAELPKMDKLSFTFLLILTASTLFVVCYGQTLRWNSVTIQALLFISASSLVLFVASCLSSPAPFLHIHNFNVRGVMPALLLAVLVVCAHVGIRVEVILYGRNILGYTPTQISLLFLLPLCCYLLTLVPSAIIAATTGRIKAFTFGGLALLITSALLLSRLDANVWNYYIIFAVCLDYISYAMIDVTLTPLILRNIPPEKQPLTLSAVASFRFFGITIGIGLLAPLNVQLKQHYLVRLAAQVTESSPAAMGTLTQWQHRFMAEGSGAAQARHDALSMLQSSVQKQASIFTFDHVFLIFAFLATLAAICAFFCRRHPFSRYYRLAVIELHHQTRTLRQQFKAAGIRNAVPRPKRLLIPLTTLFIIVSLAGCTLGPNYVRPGADMPRQSEDAPEGLFLADRWWEVFGDSALNALVTQTLTRNLDLEQALARVEAARAEAGIAFADRLPAVDITGGSARRQMTEGEKLVHQYKSRMQASYYVMPDLSFELDLWGKYRRLDEAARANLLATEAARDTIRLSLTAETVRTYFLLRSIQEQRRIAAAMLDSYDRTCSVYETRYRLGQTPETTLRRFEAERARTKNTLLQLEQQQVHAEGALAVLAGYSPRELADEAHETLSRGLTLTELTLPPDIPSGLPSGLLRRRPDVRSAEGKLMAANALIGAQMASFFPSVSLTGSAGYSSTEFEEFFLGTAGVWNLGARVNLPLFEGGRLTSGLQRRQALYEEARAAYLKSVQDAFKETRDALADNRISREAYTVSLERVRTLTRSNEIMDKQYKEGFTSVMDLLDVRRQLLAAQQDCAEACRRQLDSVVLLCKAMGGGWTEETGFEAAKNAPSQDE